MNDVAREAGVSLRTVSRYVNGFTNIDPELSERIARAIAGLGYRRNLAAASIRPGRSSRTIGLVTSDLANPYYSALTRAIEASAREHGYLLIATSSDESGRQHDVIIERLMEQRVDGLIVVPPRDAGRDWSSMTPPVPALVVIDRPVAFPGADTVLSDNVGGSRSAVAVLLEHGARHPAFIGDSLSIYTMIERHRGFTEALAGHGIEVEPALVVEDAHSSEDAAAAVERLMTTTAVDAIFAANNRASVGALLAFRAVGRRLPLIGFDDFEAAQLADPAVSVVSQDTAGMGRLATELLLGRAARNPFEAERHVLPTSLILRGSERP
jgi:LacI family transcriptional regulator